MAEMMEKASIVEGEIKQVQALQIAQLKISTEI
jgi:hypothetical protein